MARASGPHPQPLFELETHVDRGYVLEDEAGTFLDSAQVRTAYLRMVQ